MQRGQMQEMQPTNGAMAANFLPSFTLRSRREVNTKDSINARHVEQWQTDPALSDRLHFYEDTNALPSRLYREPLDRNAPYQIGGNHDSEYVQKLQRQSLKVLADIQALDGRLRILQDPDEIQTIQRELQTAKNNYDTILKAQKQSSVDSISANPYFEKYDVGGDSRNIVRELRSVVHETIEDRGINESKKLLGRTFENRWVSNEIIQDKNLNSLQAYELLKPAMNNMQKTYY